MPYHCIQCTLHLVWVSKAYTVRMQDQHASASRLKKFNVGFFAADERARLGGVGGGKLRECGYANEPQQANPR
ncbi:hypothetical protein D0864_10378 [Hortaea werneckii]|uniref:Uncharacterized protein n=1 Tax=Hortaea werneckii TaxID=91943 RepID=A0A3M7E8D7_HORWE|nr:hypothetical protein D0864_10378 [Hortaea werneckii]